MKKIIDGVLTLKRGDIIVIQEHGEIITGEVAKLLKIEEYVSFNNVIIEFIWCTDSSSHKALLKNKQYTLDADTPYTHIIMNEKSKIIKK